MRSETDESGESNDQKNHTTYRNTVMKDFVDRMRYKYTNCLWKKGMLVPENATFVSWQDGHGPGLKAIIKE